MASIRVLAVLLATASAVTPIEKVINLLEGVKKDVEQAGKDEATTYGKFACFCKETTKEKSDAIEKSQDTIDETNADIGKKTATRKEKITDLGKEQKKVEDTTKKLEDATAAYEQDKATYEATNADLTKAVESAKRALKALKGSKGAAFLQVQSEVKNCLDLADALNLVQPSKHEAMTSFLQVDPSDPAYKFHSDKILGIIEDLRKDFADERTKVQDEWKKTDKAFKAEKKDLENKIDTAKKEIKKLNGEIDKLKSEIAKLKSTLVSTEADLADDSAYLKDLTVRCEDKGKAWDQRSSTRHDEVEALGKALTILKEKAADADDVNKRAMLIAHTIAQQPVKVAVAPVVVKAAAKALKAPLKESKPAAAAKPAVKKAASFLQTEAHAHRFLSKLQDTTVAFLRQEGARLNSDMLTSVAAKIEFDPFKKIKTLIQGLIERMLTESKNEATKKGFCDTELGKSETTRKNRYADVNRLDSEIEDLEAHQSALELEIEELKETLEQLRKDLKKATELRATEKSDNEALIKASAAGAQAVGEALTVLKDFYKSAAKETNFLQISASPVDEDTSGAGFDDAYKGSQDSSKAIIGLLQVIKSDYERTNRVTEADEAKALAEFVEFERTTKSSIAAKDMKKELDEQDLASTISAKAEGMKDLKTAVKLLDGALKNIEDLKPTCIDTGMSYAERVAKREEEIKALKSALVKLTPGP